MEGSGIILAPLNGLGGVYAKGAYWWPVNFGAVDGWVREGNIAPLLKFRGKKKGETR